MSDSYQLMESATTVGYSVETVDGTDPLAGGSGNRIRWPGAVMSVPSLTEDYNHQDIQPLGSGPDPLAVVKKNEIFEVEIESLISEDFIGVDELISKSLGSVDGGTGVVTPTRPIPTLSVEYGIRNKGAQEHVAKILTSTDGITYTVVINGVSFSHLASTDTEITVADALVILINAGAEPVTSDNGSGTLDEITITADVAGTPFNISTTSTGVGSDPEADLQTISGKNTSWFHLLEGAKINTVTFTFRPDDMVLLRIGLIGRKHTGSLVPVTTSGSGIEDLVIPTEPPAVNTHITYTFLRQNGTIITTLVREFDLTWTNNLERVFGDNQSYFAEMLIEGKRRFTFNMVTTKQDDSLLEISRALPTETEGQISVRVVVDQTIGGTVPGFFMNLLMATCVLAERDAELGEDQSHVSESFAGMAIGQPTLDMNF